MNSEPSFNYSFTFWVYPRGPALGTWGNIFTYGDVYENRAPGVWTNPHSFQLMCAIDAVNSTNLHVLIPTYTFTSSLWAHVAITVNTTKMLIYTNGAYMTQIDMSALGGRKAYSRQKFYGGDPFHLGACLCFSS